MSAEDQEGLCPVCGRDAASPEEGPCCKRCGCSASLARCVVKNEVYSPVQCDLPENHLGDHEAFRGDGVSESNRWPCVGSRKQSGDREPLVPGPGKKSTVWSILRTTGGR